MHVDRRPVLAAQKYQAISACSHIVAMQLVSRLSRELALVLCEHTLL